MKTVLLSIYILVALGKGSYGPVRNATISCDGVPTIDEDGEPEMGGEWAPTDARGRMVFSGGFGKYVCRVVAQGYVSWSGIWTFSDEKRENYAIMERR